MFEVLQQWLPEKFFNQRSVNANGDMITQFFKKSMKI